MKLIDTFCGIGGFSLAAHAVGIETVLFCDSKEHSPYVWQVIPRHFPGVVLHDDVRTLTREVVDDAFGGLYGENRRDGGCGLREVVADAASVRCDGDTADQRGGDRATAAEGRPERVPQGIDGQSPRGRTPADLILTAGFPCQDISYAGKGAGLDGERSGLFFEVARLADELRPRYLLMENVAALLTRGLDAVLGTLASLGYDCLWACIPACAVGAPHRRDRIWIVATTTDDTSAARLQRIYERVLAGLTPFGDLANGWPTATASDAWAGEHNRSQVIPCNGRVLTGEAGLGLGQAARGDTWPTPQAADDRDRGNLDNPCIQRRIANGKQVMLTVAVKGGDGNGRAVWPTPNKSDGERGPDYAKAGRDGAGGDDLVTTTCRDAGSTGSLNPDWVETLMNYPIGWTVIPHSSATIEEEADRWRNHGTTGYPCTDEVLRLLRETALSEAVQWSPGGPRRLHEASVLRPVLLRSWVEGRIGNGLSTPEAREEASRYVLRVLRHGEGADRHPSCGRRPDERGAGEPDDPLRDLSFSSPLGDWEDDAAALVPWPAGLGAPQHDWEPPRLTTVKENRANRLKALGNSIVPHVARLWLDAIRKESV